jgi:hypothetical protein
MDSIRPFICPVCGYDLGFEPWVGDSASHEICPSCGIEYGYDDFTGGDIYKREKVYSSWRDEWIAAGMPWCSRGRAQPPDWNPKEQLLKLHNDEIIDS